jgi:hypothetical protein
MNNVTVIVRLVAAGLALAGAVLVLQSTQMGIDASNAMLRANGGGMDTAMFLAARQSYSESFRWLGALLFGAGTLFAWRH